jgi:ADP-ribose pyrophosphatase
MSDDAPEIVAREVAYDGFFRVERYRLRHRLYAGGWSAVITREVIDRRRAVGLLLYDPGRDEVVLVEQFRLPAHLAGFAARSLEIVAGLVDHADEADDDVARREGQEEAGLSVIGELVPMHRFVTSPGGTTEAVALFCGHVDSSRAGGIHGLPEEHEDIKVVALPYVEAARLLRDGGIENATTMIALYWLVAHREELRRRWG